MARKGRVGVLLRINTGDGKYTYIKPVWDGNKLKPLVGSSLEKKSIVQKAAIIFAIPNWAKIIWSLSGTIQPTCSSAVEFLKTFIRVSA